jgi:hypothetical protein
MQQSSPALQQSALQQTSAPLQVTAGEHGGAPHVPKSQ